MREPVDEIVYSETRPGRMETDQENSERERRNYERWDKAGPWLMPLFALVMMLIFWLGDTLR